MSLCSARYRAREYLLLTAIDSAKIKNREVKCDARRAIYARFTRGVVTLNRGPRYAVELCAVFLIHAYSYRGR